MANPRAFKVRLRAAGAGPSPERAPEVRGAADPRQTDLYYLGQLLRRLAPDDAAADVAAAAEE
ncbi:MAG: hypothetical protein QMB49_03025, partial [Collinsella sp.]